MKFTYKWLRDYLDLDISLEELADKLTFSGIEVEAIQKDVFGDYVSEVIIAEIVSIKQHPAGDNLHICNINDGKDVKQVVCGAPNCVIGMKTAYIPAGKALGGSVIEKVSLKGIESEGMLCSEKDINLSSFHEGIMELPSDAEPGKSLKELLDLDDTLYEVEITPNRPDLLGIVGIARDIGAVLNKKCNYPQTKMYEDEHTSKIISNNVPELCTRYQARIINNITISESPLWLKKRLKAVGVKPQNNVVDITNFVMLEYGHPLHAFDYNLLKEGRIVLRKANKGEVITVIDKKTYELDSSDIVIADASKSVAIAGIIGGLDTSITNKTTSILLETANFEYTSIRRTAQRLKINTDSSHRFERGLSDETITAIADRATSLIIELCNGELGFIDESYPNPISDRKVSVRISRANKLLGTKLTAEIIRDYLQRLDIEVIDERDDLIGLSIPHFRNDLTREIDIIEELIRIYGYNNPALEKPHKKVSLTDNTRFNLKRSVCDFLCYNGFYEVINSSFADKQDLELLGLADDDFRMQFAEIEKPIGADSSIMRTTLIPALLRNCSFNIKNGQNDIKLYELGKVYFQYGGKPKEKLFLSGLITGDNDNHHWKHKAFANDIFTVKGIIEVLLRQIGIAYPSISREAQTYYQQGQSIKLIYQDLTVGNIGKLDPMSAKRFDIEQAVFLFEIDLETILQHIEEKQPVYKQIVRYPTVERDISFIANKDILHQQIKETIYDCNEELIKDVSLIDEFTGKNITDNQRSLTYRLRLCSEQSTLTDDIVQNLIDTVINQLEKQYHIQKR